MKWHYQGRVEYDNVRGQDEKRNMKKGTNTISRVNGFMVTTGSRAFWQQVAEWLA